MRVKTLAVAGLFLFLPFYAALATSVNQLVVFGDSLSDNGNAANALGGRFVYLGSSNYATNAATDGPNTNPPTSIQGLWIDQFASKLGLADPKPFVGLAGTTPVLNYSGTNFAVATALTGTNPSFNLSTAIANKQVPYTADQVNIYNLFNSLKGTTANPNALYTFWAGANNIFNIQNPITAADNIMSNIQTLAGEGARYFLWLDLPDLGKLPLFANLPLEAAAATAATDLFNVTFAVDIALLKGQGIDVIPVNVNSLFASIPLNTTTAVQGMTGKNPDLYAFWDGEHPTTAADSFIANLAVSDFRAGGLTAVPEPASVRFAFLGLLTVAGAAILQRKRKTAQKR